MIVCHCNGVSEKEIVNVIKRKEATKLEHIQKLTGAGTGCGRCIPEIDRIIKNNKQLTSDAQLKLNL